MFEKKETTLFQVCFYGNCIMCGYANAISTGGKLVGGECVVRVNAPIFRSQCLASVLLVVRFYRPNIYSDLSRCCF